MRVTRAERRVAIDVVMAVLSLFSVALLFLEFLQRLAPNQITLINRIDIGIACAFLAEYLWSLSRAKSKEKHFKAHWWEIFAAIPITSHLTQVLRAIPLLRILRLTENLRLLRLGMRLHILGKDSHKLSHANYVLYLATLCASVIGIGALLFDHYEAAVNPALHSIGDSLWYAVVTTATVGYGDIHPMTTGGRIVSVALMIFGIGTLGTFIGLINRSLTRSHTRK